MKHLERTKWGEWKAKSGEHLSWYEEQREASLDGWFSLEELKELVQVMEKALKERGK